MKYLFCSFTSFGFLCPAIGIAKTLQQRGHEVAFVTGLAGAPLLRQMDLMRFSRGRKDGPSFQIEHFGVPAEILRQIRHIEYALETFDADVLVGQQLMIGTLMVSELHQLPLANIGTASYIWPTDVMTDDYPAEYELLLKDQYAETWDVYRFCREMFSLPDRETTYNETPFIGDLLLLQTVPEFEGHAQYLPDRVHLVGSCEWNPPQDNPELDEWLDESVAADLPILYLQMGTTFQFPNAWPCIAEVLGKQAVRVVASVGRMSTPPQPIPANFFVRDHISQGQILPYAHAVISSSTTTAVLGALTHGLPLLLIPGDAGEQTNLIMRCLHSGVAVAISPLKITTERLEKKIDALLHDDDLRRNAENMQQHFSQAKGAERAADLLENLAQEQQSPTQQSIA